MDALINYDDNQVLETIKRTVAVGATNEELAIFVQLCKSTGLNPFKKEAWFIKAGNRPQIMVGINGYLAVANRNEKFDGMEIDVETDPQGNPSKAIAKVYRKDRKYPSVGIALMKEFRKETPIWKQMPSVMLTKVAKSIAIREAFSLELSGTYSDVEMPPEYAASVVETKQLPVKPGDQMPQKTHYYDLKKVPDEAREEAFEWAKDKGAIWNEKTGFYESRVPLKRLIPYEVKPGQRDDNVPESFL